MGVKILLALLCLSFALSEGHDCNAGPPVTFTKNIIQTLLKPCHDWENNILISPFALEYAVGVIAFGSKGETFKEITNATGTQLLEVWNDHRDGYARRLLKDIKDLIKGQINVKLQAGTILAVNVDYMPHKEYKDEALWLFDAELQSLRFDWQLLAAANLSDYIEDRTNGRIQNLVLSSDIDVDSSLFVASYMDISVKWANRFDETATLDGLFHTIHGEDMPIQMMKGNFFASIAQNEDLQAKVLSLPFQGGNLTMTFVLPDEKDGIRRLLPKIADDVEILWKPERNNYTHVPVRVSLPKISMDTSLDGKKLLQKMGIRKLFEPEAELEEIAEGENLSLTQLRQKSVIEFNEWGVNAAAGTKAEVDEASGLRSQPEHVFTADHPFLFTITVQPGNEVLFFGVYGGEVDDSCSVFN